MINVLQNSLLSFVVLGLSAIPTFAAQPLHGNTKSMVYHAADCEHYWSCPH